MTVIEIFHNAFVMHLGHMWLMVKIPFFTHDLVFNILIMYSLVNRDFPVQRFHILELFIRTKGQISDKAISV